MPAKQSIEVHGQCIYLCRPQARINFKLHLNGFRVNAHVDTYDYICKQWNWYFPDMRGYYSYQKKYTLLRSRQDVVGIRCKK